MPCAAALVASLGGCGARNDLPGAGSDDGGDGPTPISEARLFFTTADTFQGRSLIAGMADMQGTSYATFEPIDDISNACAPTFADQERLLFVDGVHVWRLDLERGRLDEAPFPGTLGTAYDVALDDRRRIYIADGAGNRVIRYDTFTSGDGFAFDGTDDAGRRLANPYGVAVRADGKIFIADTGNARVVQVDDLVGNGWREWQLPVLDRTPQPWDVAFDAAGRIHVTDFEHSVLYRIDDIDGSGEVALSLGAYQVSHVAVGADGRIYLSSINGVNAIVAVDDMDGSGLEEFTGPEGAPLVNPCGIAVR